MLSVVCAVFLLLLPSPKLESSAAPVPATASATGGRNCTTSCGRIGIPYPFGLEAGCYHNEGFKLTCTNDSSLFVGYGTEVLELDLANGTMLINVQRIDQSIPDTPSSSNDYLTGTWSVIGQGELGPYALSNRRNKLVVVGCNVQALLMALDYDILSTCAAFCSPVSKNIYNVASPDCSGVGCCQATIPTGLPIYLVQFRRFNGSWSGKEATVFIADADRLSSYQMDRESPSALPAVVEWVISNTTCPAGNMTSPECLSSHSFCQNSTTFGSGHRCHCSPGYAGNPYVFNGCTDINECQFPEIYPCFGECNNTQGGYLCHCPRGYQGDAYTLNGCRDVDECAQPETYSCYGICVNVAGTFDCRCPQGTNGDPFRNGGCITNTNSLTGLDIALIVSGGFSFLIAVLAAPFITRKIQLQRVKRMKQKYFKQNRGLLLQHLISKNTDIGERMIITLREVEKATDNFDKTREVGGGGHGIVYKGILNLNVVAIKKSKIAVQREIDDFINEVAILSQVNHRNVVKLMGCCLETEVPLLVYEFISNGTLYHYLHVEGPVSLSWHDRLRIVVEVARALSYLHSAASMPIYHRDIKSSNILLDDNLTAKVSDFGASRYIPIDQIGITTAIQGTIGYLDPTYYYTGRLTNKSDVYSFGVMVMEMLTRNKPFVYRSNDGDSLVSHFGLLFREGKLVDIIDPQVMEEENGDIQEIAALAVMCTKLQGEDRPTMREVEMMLENMWAKDRSANNTTPACRDDIQFQAVGQRASSTLEVSRQYTMEEAIMLSATYPR